MPNTPRGREKNITGQGKSVYKHGEGLGTGPVGSQSGHQGRPGTPGASSGGNAGLRAAGKSSPLLIIIIIVVVLLMRKGGGTTTPAAPSTGNSTVSNAVGSLIGGGTGTSGGGSSGFSGQTVDLSSILGGVSASNTSSGWNFKANTGTLDTSVAKGARAKYTKLRGNGKDTVNIMVYMCGTDLESNGGMGTADLQEMLNATISDKVNLFVYTGGCRQWKNNVIQNNCLYKIESGGIRQLQPEFNAGGMTKPATLTGYIKQITKSYSADRQMLIFWDHGGGSVSGYGYDETNKAAGSMTLKDINKALGDAKVKFDFVGFDACLMATTENALMLSQYADYLIASEETEPGVGWYYTNWLTKLSQNTSMPTIEIGKNIVDDFVDVCAQKCPGQKTTLSVVDLAELEHTAPQELKDFAASTSSLIQSDKYQTVASARSGAREFSPSSRIDQVDLVSFAAGMGTAEGKALANALLGAVKYNRTSSNMTDAYGLSIYFPYRKVGTVDSAVATFDAIGMDDDYLRCIQQFASMETGGQAVSGGSMTANPLLSLLGGSSTGSSAGAVSSDMIGSLLNGLLGGNLGNVAGLTGSNSGFLGKGLDVERATTYLTDNRFDAEALVWTAGSTGQPAITLGEAQWAMVQDLELNVFVDDGEGFIDLGLDNVYDITEYGELLGDFDGTWLAINDQPVAYYHEETFDDGSSYTITGRVPVLLDGVRADLILVFDDAHPYGVIAGARYDYRDGETDTVAKSYGPLEAGTRIDFLCDYYTYDGVYQDSYLLGEPMTVTDDMVISNVYLQERYNATYRFTDIYQQDYWTPVMP